MKLFAIIFSAILAAAAVIYVLSVRSSNMAAAAKAEAGTMANLERMANVIPKWVDIAEVGGKESADTARTQLTDLVKTFTMIGEGTSSPAIKRRAEELKEEANEALKKLR